jgi:hypothetical protein
MGCHDQHAPLAREAARHAEVEEVAEGLATSVSIRTVWSRPSSP